MKLSQGITEHRYTVKSINLETKAKRRLEILGMTESVLVEVLNSKRSGTKIIKVRGTRFALGKGFAEGIEVEEV